MLSERHYIQDEWLALYASGHLELGPSLMVEAHLDLCPELLPRLYQFETIGGAFLDNMQPGTKDNNGDNSAGDNSISDDSAGDDDTMLAKIMTRIEASETENTDASCETVPDFNPPSNIEPNIEDKHTIAMKHTAFPPSLKNFLGYDIEQINWRMAGLRSKITHLWQGNDKGMLWMFRSTPGTVTPVHAHSGREWTLILQGGYTSENKHFVPGDLHQVDASDQHQPIMDQGEDCICLVYSDGPTKYVDFLPKIVQLYTRI